MTICKYCHEHVGLPCKNEDDVRQFGSHRALKNCGDAFAQLNALRASEQALRAGARSACSANNAKGPLTGTMLDNTKHVVSKTEGNKFDDGKLRFDLVPHDAVAVTCAVWTYGALKYDDRNWELGMDRARLRAAAARHRTARLLGEDYDPETGLLHLAHEAANVMMELALFIRCVGADTGALLPSHVAGFIKKQAEQAVTAGRAARAAREGKSHE